MSDNTQKTPLFDWHKQFGAKMVAFGGWTMPVSYQSVLKEHHAVRTAAGIFDVSHMGEFRVKGTHATAFLNFLTINDTTRLNIGQGQYTAMLLDSGGIIDDLIIYRIAEDDFLICANAANIAKDYSWIAAQLKSNPLNLTSADLPTLVDESAQWSQFALQGPNTPLIMERALSAAAYSKVAALDYMGLCYAEVANATCLVARTGYTGEFGYEIYLPADASVAVWKHLLEVGHQDGLVPCGLGARDTLRLEACYPLYGNDFDAETTPFEGGIKWAVRMNKGSFVGKSALEQQLLTGVRRGSFAFKMEGDGIPRHGMEVYRDQVKLGHVTSGSVLPSVGGAGGLALLEAQNLEPGQLVEIDIRGKRKLARIVKRPLYSPRVR